MREGVFLILALVAAGVIACNGDGSGSRGAKSTVVTPTATVRATADPEVDQIVDLIVGTGVMTQPQAYCAFGSDPGMRDELKQQIGFGNPAQLSGDALRESVRDFVQKHTPQLGRCLNVPAS